MFETLSALNSCFPSFLVHLRKVVKKRKGINCNGEEERKVMKESYGRKVMGRGREGRS